MKYREMIDLNGFYIKKFSSIPSTNGEMYNVDIYYKGKKVANAIDHGDGGPIWFDWQDKEALEIWEEHIKTLPKIPFNSVFLTYDDDVFLEEIINDYLFKKELKKHCGKNKVCWAYPDDEIGTYKISAKTFDDVSEGITQIKKLIKNAGFESFPEDTIILNEWV